MEPSKPQVGDQVTIRVPGEWERTGKVLETDYHPLGTDDAVMVDVDDCIGYAVPQWYSLRYVTRKK